MTIVSVPAVVEKNKRSQRKHKRAVNEESPLLPKRKDDLEFGHEGLNGASFFGAVFNLSTTIVGAGIMALPATMKVLGLGPGIAMVVLMAFLTEASIEMLIRFSKPGQSESYGELMGEAFGKAGRVLLQFCVAVNTGGVLIVYMIIMGDVLSGTTSSGLHHLGVLQGWFGIHWWNGRFFVLLITTACVLAPLASFKRIDSLSYTSALSVALAVLFVAITAGITIVKLINGSILMPKWLPTISDLSSIWKLFTVIPVLVTAYICHFNVHPIQNELEDSSQIRSIVQTSLSLCSTVYIITSIFGFLLFGESTLDDILANFDANLGIPYSSLFNDVIRISYVLHLMFVFPIIFFAVRLSLDGLFFPMSKPLSSDNRRFAFLSIGIIAVVFLGANFIPSIWDAFQFTGATTAVSVAYIFPAAVTLRDVHGIATRKDKILSIFMIILAVLSSAIAIYSNAYSIFWKSKNGPL